MRLARVHPLRNEPELRGMPGTRTQTDAISRKRKPSTQMDVHSGPDDRFFRHLVSSMRNGVLAIHRGGTLALMNDEAYRIFSLTRGADDIGRPSSELFRRRPELVRALSGVFEMTTLPNRAELRLKDLDRV